MFRVVIIDDEPLILRNLKNSIQSAEPLFRVVGTATDGKTGLELIRTQKPDVVFVDICMPVMGGLDMVEELRSENQETAVVILSGYQEFDYAKKAISLGVIDYLVKPLNPLTLKDFLERLKEKLAVRKKEDRAALLEKVLHYNRIAKDEEELFSKESRFYLVKICFGAFNFFRNNQFSEKPMLNYMEVLKEVCEKIVPVEICYWMMTSKYENEILMVLEGDKQVKKLVYDIYEMLSLQLSPEYYVSFAAAEREKLLSELAQEQIGLDSILYHNSIFGKSAYLEEGRIEEHREQKDILSEQEEKLKLYMEQKNTEDLSKTVKILFDKSRELESTQADLIGTLKKILKICCRQEYEYDIDFLTNAAMIHSRDYDTLYERFMEIIREYSDLENGSAIDELGAEYMVCKVQDYLDIHFSEKVLIQEVAEKFGFNYSYLCHLFRKYRNISPNEYIITKRMEKAKKLLVQEADWSIKKVAKTVGYEDQYYFSRIFKTSVGVTPSDYRKGRKV